MCSIVIWQPETSGGQRARGVPGPVRLCSQNKVWGRTLSLGSRMSLFQMCSLESSTGAGHTDVKHPTSRVPRMRGPCYFSSLLLGLVAAPPQGAAMCPHGRHGSRAFSVFWPSRAGTVQRYRAASLQAPRMPAASTNSLHQAPVVSGD